MRRELIISYAAHGFIILLAFIFTAFSRPMKLPEKVYSVKIVAAPQPKTVKQPKEKPIPEPEEKPQIETRPEPKPQRKPEPPPRNEPEPRRTTPTGKGHVTVDGADFKDDYYLNLIYMKVYRNWIKPTTGRELTATIYFKIARNGEVKDAKVEKRSGSASYDQKALRTILASSPFPELPDNYTSDHLGVHFEFAHRP
ncbi:hypothetical protein DRQ36_07305 [bacterium]|nr:MAG: hypothetical protein DRQ36_07305 [bacterium]